MPVPVPAYMRINQYIIGLVSDSKYEPSQRILSERELCDIFKVTRPTVRKALKDHIEDGMLIVKPGLGTFINPEHQKNSKYWLKTQLKIGLIFGRGQNISFDQYHWTMLADAGKILTDANVTVRIINLGQTGINAGKEIEHLMLDGILWFSPLATCIETIAYLQSKKIPVMVENVPSPDGAFDFVAPDYEDEGITIARHFIERGHKNIVFISCEKGFSPIVENIYHGFFKEMVRQGIKYNEKLCLSPRLNLHEELKKMIEYHADFTAIFALGTFLPVVAQVLHETGKHTPDDYYLMTQQSGRTDLLGVNAVKIAEPLSETAVTAAKMLLEKIQGRRTEPVRILLKSTIQGG